MHVLKQKTTYLAVAAALAGFAATPALATVTLGTASTIVSIASETSNASKVTVVNSSGDLGAQAAVSTFGPSAAQPLYATVSLTGGAKFASQPKLICKGYTNAGATAILRSATWNLGGAGSATASFTMNSATLGSTAVKIKTACFVTGSNFTSATVGTPIGMVVKYRYGSLASSTVQGDLIKYTNAVSASVATTTNYVANVTTGFKQFTGAVRTAAGSLIKVKQVANVRLVGGTSTNLVSAILKTASVTLDGALLGVAKTGKVFLVKAATSCASGATTVGKTGVNGPASPITVKISTSAQGILSAGVKACVVVNGSTAIPTSSVTVSLSSSTPKTGYGTLNLGTANSKTIDITRNGSSTTALNITNATNSDVTFVRIHNVSGSAGKLMGTLVNESGATIGTGNFTISASMPAKSVVVLNSTQLEALAGTTWTGRARLDLVAEVPTGGLRAQNMIRTANGTLVNVGGDTSGNSTY